MVNYYVKRVAHAFMVLLTTLTVSFALFRMLPFGPYEIMKLQIQNQMAQSGETMDAQTRERINARIEAFTNIDPDQTMVEAYFDYLFNIIVYQDFGKSITHNEAVWPLMLERMQWTLFYGTYGFALGVSTALILGAVMAYNEGSRFDQVLTYFTVTNETIPGYIAAIILLIVFGLQLGWLPTGAREAPGTVPGLNIPYMIGIVQHATLISMAGFVAGFGGGLDYRGNCIRELGKDYIRVAHLRGLSDTRIAIRYVGRNSLLPIYTGLLLGIAGLLGGSVILEWIFNYPAMGDLLLKSLFSRDYPLLMGSLVLFTGVTLTGLLVADLTYGIIDPRVQGGAERESF